MGFTFAIEIKTKKMKRIFFIIIAIVLTVNTFANNEKGNEKKTNKSSTASVTTAINGTVVDQITGEALTGVKVTIEGTNQVVYTDFDGNFSFKSLTPGEYNINVDYISYKANKLQKVNIEGTENSIKIGLKTVNE